MCSVILYLNVYTIILHLCKVFLSLWLYFVWIVVMLEIINVNFHSSTPYQLVDLQQWPIYSSMLPLYSISSTKIPLFHEIYLISPCKYVCLCIWYCIIYSCVAMCKWTNRWRSCDHTSICVFSVLSIIFIFTITINPW